MEPFWKKWTEKQNADYLKDPSVFWLGLTKKEVSNFTCIPDIYHIILSRKNKTQKQKYIQKSNLNSRERKVAKVEIKQQYQVLSDNNHTLSPSIWWLDKQLQNINVLQYTCTDNNYIMQCMSSNTDDYIHSSYSSIDYIMNVSSSTIDYDMNSENSYISSSYLIHRSIDEDMNKIMSSYYL